MGRSRKEPEYKPHPLLEKLRPPLKISARRSLLKSMERVGQLSEILVTADGFILDGRARLEFAKELNLQPRIRYLTMHSCVGELPPGYDYDWEMEQVRDVIEETGRGKWQNSLNRREGDQGTENCTTVQETMNCTTVQETMNRLSPSSFKGVPCDGKQVSFRMPKPLLEHLELMAAKTDSSRGKGRNSKQSTGPTVNEYIRHLCWADFINHLPDDT